MTFAEFVLIAAVAIAVYKLLTPVRRRLEFGLTQFFRKRIRANVRPVIDITDYQKPKDPK